MWSTEQIYVLTLIFYRQCRQTAVATVVAKRADWPAGEGPAVVRSEDDNGVVEFPGRIQILGQLADILVDVIEHRRVDLHMPSEESLVLGRERIPWLHRGIGFGKPRPRRDDA